MNFRRFLYTGPLSNLAGFGLTKPNTVLSFTEQQARYAQSKTDSPFVDMTELTDAKEVVEEAEAKVRWPQFFKSQGEENLAPPEVVETAVPVVETAEAPPVVQEEALPEVPAPVETTTHEDVGSGHDAGAAGHELVGREDAPKPKSKKQSKKR